MSGLMGWALTFWYQKNYIKLQMWDIGASKKPNKWRNHLRSEEIHHDWYFAVDYFVFEIIDTLDFYNIAVHGSYGKVPECNIFSKICVLYEQICDTLGKHFSEKSIRITNTQRDKIKILPSYPTDWSIEQTTLTEVKTVKFSVLNVKKCHSVITE